MSIGDLFGDRGADLSECGRYRYLLWRRWSSDPICVFVMLNPSTADANVDVVLVDRNPADPGPASLMLTLGGRVNLETRRSSVAYLMPTDGAAAICSELFGLAERAGGDFLTEFQARLDAMP